MALEQLHAFRAGADLWSLGPVEHIGPDEFPLLVNSDLREEHLSISKMIEEVGRSYDPGSVRGSGTFAAICQSDDEHRTRFALALLERVLVYDARESSGRDIAFSGFFGYGPTAKAIAILWEIGLRKDIVARAVLEWFTCYRFNHYGTTALEKAVHWIVLHFKPADVPAELRMLLRTVRDQLADVDYYSSQYLISTTQGMVFKEGKWLDFQIDQFLGRPEWAMLAPVEFWVERAMADMTNAPEKESWELLFGECSRANSAKPSNKWLCAAGTHVKRIGNAQFESYLIGWLPLIGKGRTRPTLGNGWENVDEQQRMHEANARVLKGLLWACSLVPTANLARSVCQAAIAAYKKVPGLGPRAVKVGNAAVYALSKMGTLDAISQLGVLHVKVKFGTAQKEIGKGLSVASEKMGLPREEIEELAVPSYGLSAVGLSEEKLGDFTARLKVTGTTSTELVWIKADGTTQKSVPAVVKEKHAEELKDLKAASKDIERMLPAQRDRIDQLWLRQKSWGVKVWRERYLDHPLMGVLGRRLLWEFKNKERSVSAIWFEGKLVDLDLREVVLSGDERVRLWHPIGKEVEEVTAWRDWLDTQQIQQPFKQAHREVYLVTDAERRTATYSNRFAAHVLKQHQFNALCSLRGWKNQLRLMVDADYLPPTLHLPEWGLRAEYWIETVGDDYRTDTNESGVYLRVVTDQVRFYREGAAQHSVHAGGGGYRPSTREEAAEPVPLVEVPELVFSEVMRDVDLFVGVTSLGNDPTWADGGPDGRFRNYWGEVSFGELSGSAKTRKAVLEKLIPRLKIASKCSFEERFLVVQGKLRAYKIHLGSGNILMKPNDQYLCIVPKAGTIEAGKVVLPFEGDRTLSVILSKAFLLAEDDRIKDESIVRQIRQG